MEVKEIKSRFTSTSYQRALRFVKALDQGNLPWKAYQISHPNCKDSTAKVHCYSYLKSNEVKQAITDYYTHNTPPWCSNTQGLASKMVDIHTHGINNDNPDLARRAIMDIAKLQGLTDKDNIHINTQVINNNDLSDTDKDKLSQRIRNCTSKLGNNT